MPVMKVCTVSLTFGNSICVDDHISALSASFPVDQCQRQRPRMGRCKQPSLHRSQGAARPRPCPARTLCRSASTPPTKGRSISFSIPIDYSQLLGLKGRESYLEPHIVAAFEDLASTVVEEGYSSRVQDGKLRMLDQAVDEVSHSTVSMDGEVQVQWDDLPGALALLQEVGEYDLVVAMGTKLLEKWESRGFRRDILLSMALAQCGLAADTFAVQQVSAGCARMEEALLLLSDGGAPPLAPALQHEIRESLQTLKPQCVLDHLKVNLVCQLKYRSTLSDADEVTAMQLPLALEHTSQRMEALHALTDLLTAADTKGAVDAQYLQQALLCLTAAEVVQLLDWAEVAKAPVHASWQTPSVYKQAATAHLVVGFQERQPSHISVAEHILQRASKDRHATVERVVCKVLLGQPESALETLGITEGAAATNQRHASQASGILSQPESQTSSSDGVMGHALDEATGPSKAEAAAFVCNHSPDPQDLLPGLCLLTEKWLHRVAFPASRQVSQSASTSLVDYFQDSRVETYIQSQEEGESSSMWSNIRGWTHNAGASVQRLVQQSLPTRHPQEDLDGGWEQQARQPQLMNPLGWSPALQGLGAASLMLLAALLWSSLRRTSLTDQRLPSVQAPGEASTSQQMDAQDLHVDVAPHAEQQRPMSAAQAEKIVRSWQSAKTAALGPRRDLDALPDILTDPMLSRFRSEAAQAEETGWFWKYKVSSVQVHSVSPVDEDGAVTITATLKEKADLYGANGKHADSYNNPYTVEYAVVEDEGQWRIIDALVLGTQSS